jgi:hypothetical protein
MNSHQQAQLHGQGGATTVSHPTGDVSDENISPAADRLQHPRTLEAAIISIVYAVDSQLGHLAQVPRW